MIRQGNRISTTPNIRGVQINRHSMQYRDLVSAWLYNESAYSLTIRDLVGPNDGTVVTGAGWQWQPTDNCCGMGIYSPGGEGGGRAYVNTNNITGLQVPSTGMTICVWLRLYQTSGATAWPGVMGRGDSDSTTSGSYLMYITGQKLSFFVWSGGARSSFVTGNTTLDYQGTYHVAATWKPSSRVAIYVNGILDAETTTSVPATIDNPSYWTVIGTNQGSGGNLTAYPFRGVIHEARFYSVAKSKEEMFQFYNPATRWELYQSPQRFVSYPIISTPPAGRVFGPAIQII